MKCLIFVITCLFVCVLGRMGDTSDMMTEDDYKPGDNMVMMNFRDDCMDMMNEMINYQMETVFQYIAIATWFRRYDVDIVGMSLMYNAWARMKLNNGKMMMMYIIKRGGTINFMDVAKPEVTMWTNPGDALNLSLMRERKLTMMVNKLAKHSKTHSDVHMMTFLQDHMVNMQADYLFEVAAHIKKLENGGPKFGLLSMNTQMVKKYKDYVDCESDVEKYKWNY